jgi:hypothetical protein
MQIKYGKSALSRLLVTLLSQALERTTTDKQPGAADVCGAAGIDLDQGRSG